MTRPSRQLLAVVVVATALCADHVASAVPRLGPTSTQSDAMPQVVRIAGRLVNSLSKRFSQGVAQQSPARDRQVRSDIAAVPTRGTQSQTFTPVSLDPFQFRLPPPIS